jgi:heme/copper-type cytochrome/quinol oxidase subunit 2
MFEELDVLWWVILPAMFIIVLVVLFFRARINKDPNPLNKAFRLLKLNIIALVAFLAVLWLFALPQTSILSTSGYPKSVEDIQSPKLLLEYLQAYNRAVVRTTSVLYWFIFTFAAWFLSAVYTFAKAITEAMAERNKNL